MEKPAKRMSIVNMVSATGIAKNSESELIERATDMKGDRRKKERKKRNYCRWCFYTPRMGGQSCTNQPCGMCGEIQHYGSTDTDALCLACAKKYDLCKHCGGDVEMRVRRRKWPQEDNR